MADDLIQRLTEWLRKRGEPDSGIRYEAGSHSNTRGVRHSLSHVELHGTDADFIAKHFHGQGARDLATELTRLTAGEPVAHAMLAALDDFAKLDAGLKLAAIGGPSTAPGNARRQLAKLLLPYLNTIERALKSQPTPPRTYEDGTATHRHKKRGSEYVLIGFGNMQTSVWSEPIPLSRLGINKSVDMNEVAIYRSVDDGSLWVRPREEFEDGRFEALLVSP